MVVYIVTVEQHYANNFSVTGVFSTLNAARECAAKHGGTIYSCVLDSEEIDYPV